jgi:hypothetical protein
MKSYFFLFMLYHYLLNIKFLLLISLYISLSTDSEGLINYRDPISLLEIIIK